MAKEMTKTIDYALHDVQTYINWIYFFHAWGFAPRFSEISEVHNCPSCRMEWISKFSDEEKPKAKEAQKLYDDACQHLRWMDARFSTHARFMLCRANAKGDNILIYKGDETIILPLLRQQATTYNPCICLSDFIMPRSMNQEDTLGIFATSIDAEAESLFEDDPWKRMLTQTLCDRLSEATAEKMHEQVRREYWGYAPNESFQPNELWNEPFQGIRPAVGYPSLPDQSINFLIDSLIDMKSIGIILTENGAMKPHASVSGLMFAHPQSRYFGIGKIGNDQLADYAKRRGTSEEEMRRFLAANL